MPNVHRGKQADTEAPSLAAGTDAECDGACGPAASLQVAEVEADAP